MTHKLDADLERGVRRIERMPVRVVAFGFVGAGGMLAIDWLYNHQLTVVAWMAVGGIATVTIPFTAWMKWQSEAFASWASEQQRRRLPPDEPPDGPIARSATRPRTPKRAT